MSTMFDPWMVLGVPAGSDPTVVRAAWRRCVRRFHPDSDGGGDVEKFLAVQRAYEMVSSPVGAPVVAPGSASAAAAGSQSSPQRQAPSSWSPPDPRAAARPGGRGVRRESTLTVPFERVQVESPSDDDLLDVMSSRRSRPSMDVGVQESSSDRSGGAARPRRPGPIGVRVGAETGAVSVRAGAVMSSTFGVPVWAAVMAAAVAACLLRFVAWMVWPASVPMIPWTWWLPIPAVTAMFAGWRFRPWVCARRGCDERQALVWCTLPVVSVFAVEWFVFVVPVAGLVAGVWLRGDGR